MSEKVEVPGENVVIIGGGLVGFETAEFLAARQKKVTVLYANLGIPTYIVGDCKKAGVALDAFKDAYHAVLEINK